MTDLGDSLVMKIRIELHHARPAEASQPMNQVNILGAVAGLRGEHPGAVREQVGGGGQRPGELGTGHRVAGHVPFGAVAGSGHRPDDGGFHRADVGDYSFRVAFQHPRHDSRDRRRR